MPTTRPVLDPGRGLEEVVIQARGRTFRTVRAGAGEPTVVFEAGLTMSASAWVAVQRLLGRQTSTLSYDRAGYGGSSSTTESRGVDDLVADLEAVLEASQVEGPAIVVGHSRGGVVVRRFAQVTRRPLAGVVLVDATISDVTSPRHERLSARFLALIAGVSRFGVQRPLVSAGLKDRHLTLDADDRDLVRRDGLTSFAAASREALDGARFDLAALERQGLPEHCPVTFVMGTQAESRAHAKARVRFLEATRRQAETLGAEVVLASRSSHYIAGSEPDLLATVITNALAGSTRRSGGSP